MLEATEISIRIASAPTDIYTATAKCATSAIATRPAVAADRLIVITIASSTISVTASRATIIVIRVISAFTRSLTTEPTVVRVILNVDMDTTFIAFEFVFYCVVLMDTLSAVYMATLMKYLWQTTSADTSLTEFALEARLIVV